MQRAVLLALALFWAIPASAEDLPPSFLRLAESARSVQSLDTLFEQEKQSLLFAEPQRSTGRFSWRRPDTLRWSYDELGTFLSVAGQPYWISLDGTGKRIELPMDPALSRTLMALMTFDLEGIARAFSVSDESASAGPRFRLTPLPGVPSPFTSVVLEVDPGGSHARRVELEESGGDRTIIRFKQVKENPEFPAGFLDAPGSADR